MLCEEGTELVTVLVMAVTKKRRTRMLLMTTMVMHGNNGAEGDEG